MSKIISLIESILLKLGIQVDIRFYVNRKRVHQLHNLYQFDIINSHLFMADRFVTKTMANKNIPIVISDHGDYKYIVQVGLTSRDEVFQIFSEAKRLIYVSESNKIILMGYLNSTDILHKIYYGYPKNIQHASNRIARKQLGIKDSDVVFGLVARGIPEKGWKQALYGFNMISQGGSQPAHLILVGDSEYLRQLKLELGDPNPKIHFVGFSLNPEYWIDSFDVGLLPTYFSGESLPNTIIEYLAYSKPVISSNIGGIEEMISVNGKTAGIVVPINEEGVCSELDISIAMESFINERINIKTMSNIAEEAFEKFDMENCSKQYLQVFSEALKLPVRYHDSISK